MSFSGSKPGYDAAKIGCSSFRRILLTSAEESKGNGSFGCKSLWKSVVLVNQPP